DRDQLPGPARTPTRRRRRRRPLHLLPRPARHRRSAGTTIMITDQVRSYFGFERLPFDRSLAVSQMFGSASHQDAAARINYAIATRPLAVLPGELRAGRPAAVRAPPARLDASRHQLIYLPNPQVGARGIHHAIVSALGGVPRFHHATLIPQAADALA